MSALQRRSGKSVLVPNLPRPPCGVPLRRRRRGDGGERDVDATTLMFTVSGITVTPSPAVNTAVSYPNHPPAAAQAILAITPPTVSHNVNVINGAIPITNIGTVQQQLIGATISAVTTHRLAATIVTAASFISPAPLPSACTSCGVGPRRGAGSGRSGFVVAAPRPTSGCDDGRGWDELAAASTTLSALTITASAIHPFTTTTPAHPPVTSSWAISIDNGSSGDRVMFSSLLPMAAMVMLCSSSIGDCGGVSGIPHEVRRIAVHPHPPPSVVRGGSAWRVGGRPTAFAKIHLADAPPRPGHPASLLPSST